jgi:hypothetical protein
MKTAKGTELPLISLKGKEYLEVKYRLVWFREEHPDWSIETESTSGAQDYMVMKATIKDQSGRVLATAHKREDQKHFPDFMEKAETGAIGRALALVGYGTQFAPEIEEGERIVDAPVERHQVANGHSPRVLAPTSDTNSLENFTVGFGKYKGQTLGKIGLQEAQGYLQFIKRKAREEGKELRGQVLDFAMAVEALAKEQTNDDTGDINF